MLVGNGCFSYKQVMYMCRFLSARRGRQAGDKARAYDWAVEKEGGQRGLEMSTKRQRDRGDGDGDGDGTYRRGRGARSTAQEAVSIGDFLDK